VKPSYETNDRYRKKKKELKLFEEKNKGEGENMHF